MNKILIVEDNKTLAKLIAKKIKETLHLEVDVAYSLQEAKLFLKAYKYFLCLLDLNLPDAPNGEIVDYALKREQHIIVLTGNMQSQLRERLLQKDIIDYVNKGNMSDINYVIQTIDRLHKNQNHKILVVDDSLTTRNHMKKSLQNLFFEVITVAHGEEAMNILDMDKEISLVLTDYNMPVMNGLELTDEIRKTYAKNQLTIIAISSHDNNDINAKFLKHGANDFIKKPFSKEEFSCRINNYIEALENSTIVQNHSKRDMLTGLYNKSHFLRKAQDHLNSDEKYSLCMISIDDFHMISEKYTYEIGNKLLVYFSEILRSFTDYHDLLAKFDNEEFALLLRNQDITQIQSLCKNLVQEIELNPLHVSNDQYISFTISSVIVGENGEDINDLIAEADMLLYKAKQNGGDITLST